MRTKTLELTARQRQLLELIPKVEAKLGRCPTRRELAKELGCTGHNIQLLLQQLYDKGVVSWDKHLARTLKVVPTVNLSPLPAKSTGRK